MSKKTICLTEITSENGNSIIIEGSYKAEIIYVDVENITQPNDKSSRFETTYHITRF